METRITEMFLCESAFVFLRPDLTYKFVVDPECERCKKHLEIVRDTMPENWNG